MKRWIGHSLRRKLSLIILVSTLVPILSFGAFTYLISSKITEEKAKQSAVDTLKQMEGKLDFVVRDIENISLLLIGQGDIQEYLSGADLSDGTRRRLLDFMMNLASSKKYIAGISIHPRGDGSVLSNTAVYASELDSQVRLEDVEGKTWTGVYEIANYSGTHQVISFVRPLRSIYNYGTLGWLVISLDEPVIADYLSEPMLGEGRGQVALLGDGNRVLSATEKSWLSQPFDEILPGAAVRLGNAAFGETITGEGRDKKTVLYYRQPQSDWTLAATIPYDLYRSQNRYILQLTAAAVLLMVLITGGLVLFVVQRVTNPLRILTRLLTKINPDGIMPVYHSTSYDEIGRLGESYNLLGQHIRALREQLIRDETRKKEADIRALQAQINPHFLYNTLSSVHWMALMAKETRIAAMVGALSDFLQFSLNKGSDFCPVRQELAHVRNYVEIQSIRYPDKFEVDVSADPDIQEIPMLKLLLQPLLENAMLHGIQKQPGKGRIAVCVHRERDDLHFLVADDGVGMSAERLQDVTTQLASAEMAYGPEASYGLRNVNERLRLHYGPGSCLAIDSRPNAGTRITFSIPIKEVSHENHDRG